MNTCGKTEQVSAYHDGELPADARREFEAHLAQCPVCRAELEGLTRLSSMLADLRLPSVPADVVERLHAAAAVAPERNVIVLARRLAAAAAVILIACGVWAWSVSEWATPRTTASSWEVAAVTLPAEDFGDNVGQTVQWIVADLTLENGHD